MAFTYVANTTITSGEAVSTVTTTTPLTVLAGDLLVVYFAHATAGLEVNVTSITDGIDNDFTVGSILRGGTTYRDIAGGYVLSANANSEAYFTGTLDTARNYLRLSVLQFRPGSGESAALDQAEATGTGTGTSAATSAVTTTGASGVATGTIQSPDDLSSYQIDGVAVDASYGGSSSWAYFYRILEDPITTGAATATVYSSSAWMAMMDTFKISAASGLVWTPHVSRTMTFGRAS